MANLQFRNAVSVSPSDVHDFDAFAMKVVAVVYPGGSWCAYQGPSHWPDDQVAAQGDRLVKEQAAPLFYVLRNSDRRYMD